MVVFVCEEQWQYESLCHCHQSCYHWYQLSSLPVKHLLDHASACLESSPIIRPNWVAITTGTDFTERYWIYIILHTKSVLFLYFNSLENYTNIYLKSFLKLPQFYLKLKILRLSWNIWFLCEKSEILYDFAGNMLEYLSVFHIIVFSFKSIIINWACMQLRIIN